MQRVENRNEKERRDMENTSNGESKARKEERT